MTLDQKKAGYAAVEADLEPLLQRMAAGEEAALERLYDATSRRAYTFVLRLVRDPQLAEEIVEEVYFQMWNKAADYDNRRGNPLAWLYTLCRSRALDRLRQRDDEVFYQDPADYEERLSAEGTDNVHDGDPYDVLAAMERSTAVHAALSSLSPQSRQVVSLAFFRGLSHSEIATAYALPLGTVKTIINRACEKMRGFLVAQAGVTP
ncbi:MAG: hypothetical protein RIR00_2101 [Pseudomonadota bacterium]|jgi:RNA polymerase sigma-70 factor (ECF subfamily)